MRGASWQDPTLTPQQSQGGPPQVRGRRHCHHADCRWVGLLTQALPTQAPETEPPLGEGAPPGTCSAPARSAWGVGGEVATAGRDRKQGPGILGGSLLSQLIVFSSFERRVPERDLPSTGSLQRPGLGQEPGTPSWSPTRAQGQPGSDQHSDEGRGCPQPAVLRAHPREPVCVRLAAGTRGSGQVRGSRRGDLKAPTLVLWVGVGEGARRVELESGLQFQNHATRGTQSFCF